MGKLESGPDMLDCATYLSEIQKQTGYSLTLLVELDGSSVSARWRIHALAVKGGSVEATAARTVAASALWPHRDFKTFEAALFSLLAWTDSLIAQDTFQGIVTA
jgi:hypothetical protein